MNNITAAILLLASLGLFFGYIQPTYGRETGSALLQEQSIKELREEQANYLDALEKSREIERTRTGLLEKYNAIPKENLEKLLRLLPDHSDSVRLIIDINNIAAKYGMTLRNITLLDDLGKTAARAAAIGPSGQKWSKVQLRFAVTGTYENFRTFLQDLEKSLRLVDLETLSFSAKDESKKEYEYSVVIATYKLD